MWLSGNSRNLELTAANNYLNPFSDHVLKMQMIHFTCQIAQIHFLPTPFLQLAVHFNIRCTNCYFFSLILVILSSLPSAFFFFLPPSKIFCNFCTSKFCHLLGEEQKTIVFDSSFNRLLPQIPHGLPVLSSRPCLTPFWVMKMFGRVFPLTETFFHPRWLIAPSYH